MSSSSSSSSFYDRFYSEICNELQRYTADLEIPFEVIKLATNNFADENLIATQSDSSRKCYRGELLDLRSEKPIDILVWAISISISISEGSCDDKNAFLSDSLQTLMLVLLKHENIRSVICVARDNCDEDNMLMITKVPENGSLAEHLSTGRLTWAQRLNICIGVGQALKYLHFSDLVVPGYYVVHGNINSSQVLLDDDWQPQLQGFESAMVAQRNTLLHVNSSEYKGTFQYVDPAYEKTGALTDKSDVFSFGVVLFEVLFGRKASSCTPNEQDRDNWNNNFAHVARSHWKNNTQDEMIDPDMRKNMDSKSIEIFLNVANACLTEQRPARPNMAQVVRALEHSLELQKYYEYSMVMEASTSQLKGKSYEHLMIPLKDILSATDNFNPRYKIGSGGFATVYKAKLQHFESKHSSTIVGGDDGSTVAIKVIHSTSNYIGERGFIAEVQMLSKCRHQNIVSLLGFCNEAPQKILIYEYVPNGSLDGYLERSYRMTNLTWGRRIQICLDIASGLDYLHSGLNGNEIIIHRDIKSANILLDGDLRAKIADFGLSRSKTINSKNSTINTVNLAGTELYLDPEYITTGKLKKASDIYSFGVVLFEILCGTLAYDKIYTTNAEKGLPSIARRLFKEGKSTAIIDPCIKQTDGSIFSQSRVADQHSLETFLNIANQCLAETQDERPTIQKVIKELEEALNSQKNNEDNLQILLEDINLATQRFSDCSCIGEGTFWKLYEGELPQSISNAKGCSAIVAKRWNKSGQGHQLFFRELEFVFKNKHENVTNLVGYCTEMEEKIIVYEHSSKESTLDKHLKDTSLTWIERIKICIDVASGLEFLRRGGGPEETVRMQGDIRCRSILIDGDRKAKISNLRLIPVEQSPISTFEQLLESEAHSLAVLLFEVLAGRLVSEHPSKTLPAIIERSHNGIPNIDDFVFEGIRDQLNLESLFTFISTATTCIKLDDELNLGFVIEGLKEALEHQECAEGNPQLSLEDIRQRTQNFRDEKCVGKGRYSKLYEIEFPNANNDGYESALVKRWNTMLLPETNTYSKELRLLSRYKNLDNIIAVEDYFPNEDIEIVIVYEKGYSRILSNHLYDASLSWTKRLKICIDVATVLKHFQDSKPQAVHGDIRSGSILIDGDWNAKLSNFEFFTTSEEPLFDSVHSSLGYFDPQLKEYKEWTVSIFREIYSFGVVLMELLCGRLAWGEGCEDHSQSLGPLANKHYKEKGNLDELVFKGIKEQIAPESLIAYQEIALECFDIDEERCEQPTIEKIVKQLKSALELQEDHEMWNTKVPADYKEIIQLSETPEVYSTKMKKDQYHMLSKGILLQQGKLWFTLGTNGESNQMISATTFSYKNGPSRKWQSIPESRFQKVAQMWDISNLNIHIRIKTRYLSPEINYGVYLVFKFCGSKKTRAEREYVNLSYRWGKDNLHAYFATWRDDEWMMIELCRFLNDKKDVEFQAILESFTRCYCGSSIIYVEGLEFRSIEHVNYDEIEKSKEFLQILESCSNISEVQQPTNECQEVAILAQSLKLIQKLWNGSKAKLTNLEMFSLNEVNKRKHLRLSPTEFLSDSCDLKPFELNASFVSRSQEVEFLPKQVFCIKCKIESQLLSPDTDYMCYLIFKFSEKCNGLHGPVIIRDILNWKNKKSGLLYFRSPSQWNIHDTDWVPRGRKDGWMEVIVSKFNSKSKLRNDSVPINLKLITYEGTMSGLIVCSLEIRPI